MFLLTGPIELLKETFKEFPGHSDWITESELYAEYIVEPLNSTPLEKTELKLFESITLDCLPYLSESTKPTW